MVRVQSFRTDMERAKQQPGILHHMDRRADRHRIRVEAVFQKTGVHAKKETETRGYLFVSKGKRLRVLRDRKRTGPARA